ncbi:hypothetical protein J6590_045048 [Homalodisca vitripennis]|nr:hypothetical protein J6590_045048 [Homalodisca vitripennis]
MLLVYVVAFSLGPVLTNSKSPEVNENLFVNYFKDIFESGPVQQTNDILPPPQLVPDNNSTDLDQGNSVVQPPTYYTNGINQEVYCGWPITPVTFNQPIQSPVDIITEKTITLELPQLSMALPNLDNTRAKLQNSGHSAVVYIYGDKFQKPFLKGGPLQQRFIFEQMHFHWGKEDIWGSEHYLDGESYSAEVHLVYYNGKYLSFKDAADKPDGLAVVAVFAEANEVENPLFSPLEQLLPKICNVGSSVKINASEAMQWPADVLGTATEYYTYPGSLTTPPFSENVVFIVLPNPITLSFNQLMAFRQLGSDHGGRILENRRQVQPLHKRPIVRSGRASQVPNWWYKWLSKRRPSAG